LKSDETRADERKISQVNSHIPHANTSKEKKKSESTPSLTTAKPTSEVVSSTIDSSKRNSPNKVDKKNKNGNSDDGPPTTASQVPEKKGTKVTQIRSIFESASGDINRSNRSMESLSRKASAPKSHEQLLS
jgi:hypothetical protein